MRILVRRFTRVTNAFSRTWRITAQRLVSASAFTRRFIRANHRPSATWMGFATAAPVDAPLGGSSPHGLRADLVAVGRMDCSELARIGSADADSVSDSVSTAGFDRSAHAISCESLGRSGEPKFHELEPDWRMAQTAGGASRRCLTAVDEHYS
jgi:hypothetical protein